VETLIEQESRDPEYPDLKKYLHVNDFEAVPIQLVDGKVCCTATYHHVIAVVVVIDHTCMCLYNR
jgi:hypothetical protein